MVNPRKMQECNAELALISPAFTCNACKRLL
jgi:hypothetical protein